MTGKEPGLPGTRTARRTRRSAHLGDRRVRADKGTARTARPRTRDEKGRRGAKASHTDGSSRWQDEDAARRLSATSRTSSTVKRRNEQRRRQTEVLLRIKVRDLYQTAWPVQRDEALRRPRQTMIDDRGM
ncbi:hypothetical protein A4X09_0g5311 [Tilletia walkeri]|uniref:Uncharacterized protein n=1 Tax=Tilletia walkeri TaxID=117179 RepID=A0A8X7N602_9BASI|nr:hypothetical protein A4X09_0g5311 [Tilletia walkeri]